MRVLNLEVILGPLLQLTLQLHLRRITREGIPGGAAGPLRYEGVKPGSYSGSAFAADIATAPEEAGPLRYEGVKPGRYSHILELACLADSSHGSECIETFRNPYSHLHHQHPYDPTHLQPHPSPHPPIHLFLPLLPPPTLKQSPLSSKPSH